GRGWHRYSSSEAWRIGHGRGLDLYPDAGRSFIGIPRSSARSAILVCSSVVCELKSTLRVGSLRDRIPVRASTCGGPIFSTSIGSKRLRQSVIDRDIFHPRFQRNEPRDALVAPSPRGQSRCPRDRAASNPTKSTIRLAD